MNVNLDELSGESEGHTDETSRLVGISWSQNSEAVTCRAKEQVSFRFLLLLIELERLTVRVDSYDLDLDIFTIRTIPPFLLYNLLPTIEARTDSRTTHVYTYEPSEASSLSFCSRSLNFNFDQLHYNFSRFETSQTHHRCQRRCTKD